MRSSLVAGLLFVLVLADAAPLLAQDRGGKQLPAELAVIPHDAFAFVHFRPAQIWQSEPMLKLRKVFPREFGSLLKYAGEDPLETESFTIILPSPQSMRGLLPDFSPFRNERKTFAVVDKEARFEDLKLVEPPPPFSLPEAPPPVQQAPAGNPFDELLFVETTVRPLDRAKVIERVLGPDAVEHKHLKRTFYTNKVQSIFLSGAVYVVNDRTYLYATNAETMKKALAKLDQPAAATPFERALELARQKHDLVVGFNTGHAEAAKLRKELARQWDASFRGSDLPMSTMLPLLDMTSAGLAFDLGAPTRSASEGTTFKFHAELSFADEKHADRASGAARDALLMARFLAGVLNRKERFEMTNRGEERVLLSVLDLLLPRLEKSVRMAAVKQQGPVLQVDIDVPMDLEALHELDFRGDFACVHIRVADILRTESAAQLFKLFPKLKQQDPVDILSRIGLSLDNVETATIVLPSANEFFGRGFRSKEVAFEELRAMEMQERAMRLREQEMMLRELELRKALDKKNQDNDELKKQEEKKRQEKDSGGQQADADQPVVFRKGEAPAPKTEEYSQLLEDAVIVQLTTQRPYDRQKVREGIIGPNPKELKHQGKSYLVTGKDGFRSDALYFADERTLLIVTPAAAMPAVLNRTALFRARSSLSSAVESAKKAHHFVMGLNFREATVLEAKRQIALEMQRAVERRGDRFESELAQALVPLLDARTLVLTADAGKDVSVQAEVTFADAQQAAERKLAVEDALNLGRMFIASGLRGEMQSQARRLLQDDRPDSGPLVFGDAVLLPGRRPVLIPERDLRPAFFFNAVLSQFEASVRKATPQVKGNTISAAAQARFDVAGFDAQALKAAIAFVKDDESDRLVRSSAANMRRLIEAMHAYHEVHGKAPASDKLSWRVHLLPFLDELALYQEFRLNEAWDSPHNVKLLPRMPKVFAPPAGIKTREPFTTHYQIITGPGTVFDLKQRSTADGLAVVEAFEADAWTKPTDIVYDAKKPLPKMGGVFASGFHVGFTGGEVRFLPLPANEALLRSLIMQRRRADSKDEKFDLVPPR